MCQALFWELEIEQKQIPCPRGGAKRQYVDPVSWFCILCMCSWCQNLPCPSTSESYIQLPTWHFYLKVKLGISSIICSTSNCWFPGPFSTSPHLRKRQLHSSRFSDQNLMESSLIPLSLTPCIQCINKSADSNFKLCPGVKLSWHLHPPLQCKLLSSLS